MKPAEYPRGVTAIYALCDPEGVPHYVGASIAPARRFSTHLTLARRACRNPCGCWIKSLLDAGQRPTLQILEVVSDVEAPAREFAWIREFFLSGQPLTNAWWLLRHLRRWYSRAENQNIVSPLEARKYPTTPGSSSPPGWPI